MGYSVDDTLLSKFTGESVMKYHRVTWWNTPKQLFEIGRMTYAGLRESIPPCYTVWAGEQLGVGNGDILLDMFSGEGGASRGYMSLGTTVIAVDIDSHALRNNPAPYSICTNAIELLTTSLARWAPYQDFKMCATTSG